MKNLCDMDDKKLDKDLVDNPREWRMSIRISDNAIDIVAHNPRQPGSLIYHRLPLPDASSSLVAVLGDVVYDNALLLSEFGTTDVLIDTPRFIIAPTEMCVDGLDEAMISELWPRENLSVISHPIVGTDETLLAGADTTIISFVRRTFPTATVTHRLCPLLSYLITKDHEMGAPGMYVNVRDNRIDVVYFSERGLRAVNTYDTPTPEDMLYYIMAVAKGCNMDINNDEMVICGDAAEAERLQASIRKYLPTALMMDTPYEVDALGAEALAAPLELTLMPICV